MLEYAIVWLLAAAFILVACLWLIAVGDVIEGLKDYKAELPTDKP